MDPLVLSLQLEPEVQARFDAERRRLFPAGRTQVDAHVTLFHALPGDQAEGIVADLAELCRRPVFDLVVSEVMPLGRGVAYRIVSTALNRLHAELARRWAPWLTRQDAQGFRPHITVQNKVDPATARRTQAELSRNFQPLVTRATGLTLWEYVGGPWSHRASFPFRENLVRHRPSC
jgi:2'-5' RNA ligase